MRRNRPFAEGLLSLAYVGVLSLCAYWAWGSEDDRVLKVIASWVACTIVAFAAARLMGISLSGPATHTQVSAETALFALLAVGSIATILTMDDRDVRFFAAVGLLISFAGVARGLIFGIRRKRTT